jgi:hypothetical protein
MTKDVDGSAASDCYVVSENDYAAVIRKVFRNVLSGVAKLNDAPVSSGFHFDAAIDELAKLTTWRPKDPELMEIIDSACAMMRLVRKQRSA